MASPECRWRDMHRLARGLLYAGVVGGVVRAGQAPRWSRDRPYDLTGSFRFGWSFALRGLLLAGRLRRRPARPAPDAPPGRLASVPSARWPRPPAASRCSSCSSATPSCPASSCSASAICSCRGTVLCAASPSDGAHAGPSERDRVVLVAEPGERRRPRRRPRPRRRSARPRWSALLDARPPPAPVGGRHGR